MNERKIPTSLYTVTDVVERLNKKKCMVTEKIILDVAESGHLPCWRWHVNEEQGPPLFRLDEVFDWVERNWLQRQSGFDFPKSMRVYYQGNEEDPVPCSAKELPHALSLMAGQIFEISAQWTGVYFLTDENEVVYVGQSVEAPSRISTHNHEKKKKFSRSFFLPVPESDLDAVEGAFIRALNPHYNNSAPGREEWDESVIIHYCPDLARVLFNDRAKKNNLVKWPTSDYELTEEEWHYTHKKPGEIYCWHCGKEYSDRDIVWIRKNFQEKGRCPHCATVLLEQGDSKEGRPRQKIYYTRQQEEETKTEAQINA